MILSFLPAGQTLSNLKIHYATLGNPKRDANRQITNAVLVPHWMGAPLLSPKNR
ncbi:MULTISPECIES: hypothetical protein [Parachlamydia]|uniref:Uncharacterized protein n=1 Tax=Parachlamydia acanthamoebae TaxID=83552 RepID=A0A0C1C1X4_9BACT|nr:hypothetical protein [Parachlamydia acanthamoebae]EFB41659.1 hypothetical protein pah_c026o099 [Parachlamydia acanthamoebae str. Hall's coccus]KIA77601.1 hypothetical protein DB43_GD00320 [Parachlamydia acanthamoebae]